MANICYYTLYAYGDVDKLNAFHDLMTGKGNDRVFGVSYTEPLLAMHIETIPTSDGGVLCRQRYTSDCRWSVRSALLRDAAPEGLTLPEAAKLTGVEIEIFANEYEFAEHVVIHSDGGWSHEECPYWHFDEDEIEDALGTKRPNKETFICYVERFFGPLTGKVDADEVYAHYSTYGHVGLGGFRGFHPFPYDKRWDAPHGESTTTGG